MSISQTVKNISTRLKEARAWRRWSQAQLAVAADVSTGTIGNIEAGIRLSKGSIPQIADALGVSYQWLANGKGEMLLGDSVHVKQNKPAAHVQQAQAAINNAVVTAECMQLCQMFASLPNDPFIKADVMGKISTMIQEARASPAHQENPETGAKQRAA